jgi:hypothetical protein
LATIWEAEIEPMLVAMPGLRPIILFGEMRGRHPELSEGLYLGRIHLRQDVLEDRCTANERRHQARGPALAPPTP